MKMPVMMQILTFPDFAGGTATAQLTLIRQGASNLPADNVDWTGRPLLGLHQCRYPGPDRQFSPSSRTKMSRPICLYPALQLGEKLCSAECRSWLDPNFHFRST